VRVQLPDEPRALAIAARADVGRTPITASIYDFAVVVRRTGRVAGACELVLGPKRTAEVGYLLGRHHWGHGYGTEVVRSLMAFAYDVLAIRQVFAVVATDNDRSQRVLEKSGFVWDGSLRPRKNDAGHRGSMDRYVCSLPIAAKPS
jgi:RimJ/RimL family protein N-acetyltransferase